MNSKAIISFSLCYMLLFCVNLLGSVSIVVVASSANETDRLALLAFKGEISEDPQGVFNSWNDSLHFCQWSGVNCSNQHPQRVAALILPNRGLVGHISPSIANLTFLREIDLSSNGFNNKIPHEIGTLFQLRRLNLNNNSLVGDVPLNLGNLKELRHLKLADNQLGSRGGKDNLDFLTALTNCSNLEEIQFGHNNLSGMLPNSIANLSTSLTVLEVPGNEISGRIPIGIENLINLVELLMYENHLSGPIPYGIGKLSNLQQLAMYTNMLAGKIPDSIGNITRLSILFLFENNFQGSIPASIGKFQNIENLDLGRNNLSGTIPVQLFDISPQLFRLDLSLNSFTGQLAAEIGRLKQLSWFFIYGNKLSGEIPSTLGDCTSLTSLYMNGNFFQGAIPLSLSKLGGLAYIDLSHNNLSGPIPEFLEKFPSLNYLNLSFNNLEGEVPKEGIFKNASEVSVLGNKNLCGGIPELQLLKCHISKQKRSFHPKITIPVICVSLLVILLSGLCFCFHLIRNQRRKFSSTSFLGGELLRVSYGELLRATDGFSSANFLGAGSYGSVYKGILERIETAVAVKVLHLQQRGASKSFMAECEALKNIRHRNLIRIITACSSVDVQGNDFKALVFEYIPNGSLEKWLHPNTNDKHQLGNLSLMERVNIAIDVASALEYLHHHGQAPIVHSDLKPSNVLLDNDMTAHVIDFGLAKFLPGTINSTHPQETNSSTVKGSVGYVAPEYGLFGKASTQGDVYSYGILLLEIFTGKRPTDEMFKDSLSLHQYAKMHLPGQIMEIIDPQLLLDDEVVDNITNGGTRNGSIQEFLVSIVQVAVACSAELPRDRMDMRKVATELIGIRDKYLGVGIHVEMEIIPTC